MAPRAEHRALLFLATMLALGGGTRLYRARRSVPTAASVSALDAQRARVDSARHHRKDRRDSAAGKPQRRKNPRDSSVREPPASPIDLDVASAEQIVRLPRVGPTLAKRIVAYRDTAGPFGSLERLRQVAGVGPSLATFLAPYVTFSLLPRPSNRVFRPVAEPPNKHR